jgi:predicted transcriptional regulator of viral defense system
MKYDSEFRKYFSKIPIFTFKDAARFLKKMGASDAYVKLFIHNQMKRHSLLRVGRGRYTFSNNEAMVGFAFAPFYYGLEHSLTLHKLWTQVSIPVIITTTKAVPGIRNSMGKRVLVRRISKNMFFGIERIMHNGVFVPVSDIEKTLVDFVYFNINLSDEETKRVMRECNVEKLARYAKKCNRGIRTRIENMIKDMRSWEHEQNKKIGQPYLRGYCRPAEFN